MDEQNTSYFTMRLTPTLRRSIDKAAKRSGLTLSDWVRATLARAAHEGAFAPQGKKGGK